MLSQSGKTFVGLCLGASAWVGAQAQVVPDAGVLLQQQRALETRPSLPMESAPVLQEAPAKPAREGEATVHVKAFRLTGEFKAFSQDELQAVLQPYVGRTLSVAQLQEAAQTITAYYKAHGYFLARTYLVRQDVTEGVITLEVREGTLDGAKGVRVQGSGLRLDPEEAEAIVRGALAREDALRLEHLERGMLLLNDLPGVNATANLEPGETAGSTRIVVDAKEGPLATGSLMADNYGNRYVGRDRLTGNLALNDLNGRGDQLAASVTRAIGGDHYDYGALGYSVPLSTNGWRLGLSVTDLTFGVGQELASQNTKGSSHTYGINARYPLQRTRAQSVYATFGYDERRLYNETAGAATSNKRLDLASMGLALERADAWLGGGIWQAGATVTSGILDLAGNAGNLSQDQSASGPHTQGHYAKLGWNLARLQQMSNDSSVLLALNGQLAHNNLDSSEKFQLGGPTGVRAYPIGEGLGDAGQQATLEARQRMGSSTLLGDIGLSVFYDWGRVQQYHEASNLGLTKPNTYALAGYGLGVSLSKSGTHDVRLMWAQKLGSNPNQTNGSDSDGTNNRRRIWVVLSHAIR